ncbi:MAG: inositol monophosphatase [Calditrichaeota bacterium]|nr:inositol monophosphatase [Calditrichota bacterium]
MNELLNTAQTAAKKAGKILMENFGKVKSADIRKKSQTDFLSYVDEQSEKVIINTIRAAFPDHSILAEESGADNQKNNYTWIIDPLDGTTNYLKSIPVFAVSIAVEFQKEIVAGVILDPVHNDLFYAAKGKGAFLNGNPVRVSQETNINESFFATGFPFKLKHKVPDYLNAFKNLFDHSVGARRMGAAAIDLAYVACGKFDGFWEIGLKPWDMAAGEILIREAGGIVTDFWNQPNHLNNSHLLTGNPEIHRQMGELIRDVFPFYKSLSEGIINE